MSGKLETKNLKECVDAVLDGVDLGKVILKDGKVGPDDLVALLASFPKLATSVQAAIADIDQVIPESKDLQSDEVVALGTHVLFRLGGQDHERAVVIAKAAIDVAAAVLKLVKAITSKEELAAEAAKA